MSFWRNLALIKVKKVQNSTTSCANIEVFDNFAHHNFNLGKFPTELFLER
jgi:hypothetical protein